ncbi:MAG: NADH-quinone oxidoreductase subunit NuoH [Planctomycetes bacterium]|nr:NADH-quinone oxidoreductase subunit NuoH [Planctomycetota bacterium]
MPASISQFLGDHPQLFVSAIVLLVMINVILITVAYLIYLERKISAYIQDRIGPNRVGFDFGLPYLRFLRGCVGLGQPLADGLKFLLKEDFTPGRVDKVLFTLAPAVIIIPAMIGFAVIPWGGVWQMPVMDLPVIGQIGGRAVVIAGAPVNVGVIYLLAVGSLGVYGVTLGGWASNNKFSFLGGLRATAQMLAYEIPLGLSLLAVLLLTGSVIPQEIIGYQQANGWLIFSQPLACIIFFIAILAEANRAPFDNAEAEQELVGGYHTEYSSMRFALFFMAEYAHMLTSCAFFALLFLGGWSVGPLPLLPDLPAETASLLVVMAKFGVFFVKVLLLVCFMMVIRWTIPRLRYDQVMAMAWQAVIPLSLVLVLMTAMMVYLGLRGPISMLAANVAVGAGLMLVLPLLPRTRMNKPVAMHGSRFRPIVGEHVVTGPTDPLALEDRPIEGTVGTV